MSAARNVFDKMPSALRNNINNCRYQSMPKSEMRQVKTFCISSVPRSDHHSKHNLSQHWLEHSSNYRLINDRKALSLLQIPLYSSVRFPEFSCLSKIFIQLQIYAVHRLIKFYLPMRR